MNITLVNRYGFPDESATSRMVSSLAFVLARNGHSVRIVASQAMHDGSGARQLADETIRGVRIHRIPTTRFGRGRLLGRAIDYLTFHLGVSWWLLRSIKAGDVCIVCTDPPLLSVTATLPIRLRGGVFVNWIMDLFPEAVTAVGLVGNRNALMAAASWLRDLSLRRAVINVAPIARMAAHLEGRGVPASKLRVLHHWSDGETIVPIDPRESGLRTEWDLQGKFVLGYCGNLGRAHEFDTILAAATRLRDRRDIVFLFVGGGYHHARLRREVDRLELGNVLFKPLQPRERLSECLAAADVHLVSLQPALEICVVPSKFYGIAAAGRPTLFIGALHGEIAQLIAEAHCGATIAIGEPELLTDWILRLQSDAAARQAMGRAARLLFEDRFSEVQGVAAWTRLLEAVSAPDLVDGAAPHARRVAEPVR